jgi:hypothetical protein
VFDLLGAKHRLFREVPRGTHFTPLEPAREDLFHAVATFLAAEEPAA